MDEQTSLKNYTGNKFFLLHMIRNDYNYEIRKDTRVDNEPKMLRDRLGSYLLAVYRCKALRESFITMHRCGTISFTHIHHISGLIRSPQGYSWVTR